ncbi:unnamed protein product [Symbiodinium sp. KB8]|nr:unnamed protein product [Symbiodinium sp. KB8]
MSKADLGAFLRLGPDPSKEVLRLLASWTDGWRRTPRPATTLLSALARKGYWNVAGQVLWHMIEESLEVNVFHCSSVISACEKSGNWRLSLALLAQMSELKIVPNQISYSAAATTCAKGNWPAALLLIYSMVGRRLPRDQVSWNAAIDACRGADWELAVRMLFDMPRTRVAQDSVSFGSAISACERGSAWEMVLHLLVLMRQAQVRLNDISCSAAISACGHKGHQWKVALVLFEEMLALDEAVTPDRFVWNAAVAACETSSEWKMALAILETMVARAVLPDVATCTSCINACNSRKRRSWPHVVALFEEMSARLAILPNIITYSAVITAASNGLQHTSTLQLLLAVDDIAWTLIRT